MLNISFPEWREHQQILSSVSTFYSQMLGFQSDMSLQITKVFPQCN